MRKEWIWQRVEAKGSVTEYSLEGPDVLCRYWRDNPPSKDALLIAASPKLLRACKNMKSLLQGRPIFASDAVRALNEALIAAGEE